MTALTQKLSHKGRTDKSRSPGHKQIHALQLILVSETFNILIYFEIKSGRFEASNMKIALTGISSFTGCHIAHALRQAGHQVSGFLTRAPDVYENDPLLKTRLEYAGLTPESLIFEAPFGSDTFLSSLQKISAHALINHGAEIKGYRSPDFDVYHAVQVSLHRMEEVVQKFRTAGGQKILHSGTVFEPYNNLLSFSPYGTAKFLISQSIEKACQSQELSFSKIYIANPIGAFENPDRLIPLFVEKWKQGQKPLVNAPRMIWDHVPAPWLANVYVSEVSNLNSSVRRPSGFCLDLESMVELFCTHARRCGVKLVLDFDRGDNLASAEPRLNNETCFEAQHPNLVEHFFSQWISSLFAPEDFS